tara:strand:+ start:457 stop:726 length:270 start_codon:yes stop_codon:yes gene_type:complete
MTILSYLMNWCCLYFGEQKNFETKMQEGQTRFTFNRTRSDKWSLHVNGVRKPMVFSNEVLKIVQGLIDSPDKLRGIMIEVSTDSIKGND